MIICNIFVCIVICLLSCGVKAQQHYTGWDYRENASLTFVTEPNALCVFKM